MKYNIFSPSQALRDVVKHYVVADSLDGMNKLLFLPNGCNFIVFNRGVKAHTKLYNEDEEFYIPQNYSVSIKLNKVRELIFDEDSCASDVSFPIILVELTPIGFYKLFNTDASILNDKYLEIDKNIEDRYFKSLYKHDSIKEELEYLDSSLNALLLSQNNTHMPIQDVLDKIVDSYRYEVTVESLLTEFGYSRSTLERDFKKVVGLTPKNFIFISKFCKTVLEYIGEGRTFSELEYLYSDSSYMNAVFKKFLGASPSVILNLVAEDKIMIYQMHNIIAESNDK